MPRCRYDLRPWSFALALVWSGAAGAAGEPVATRWSQAAEAAWSSGWQWRLDRWQTALRPGSVAGTMVGTPEAYQLDTGALRVGGAYRFGQSRASDRPGWVDGMAGAWRAGAGVGLTPDWAESRSVPYVSLGYDARWPRWGLGVGADVGVQFRRDASGSAGAAAPPDVEATRPIPSLQVNLSYSF